MLGVSVTRLNGGWLEIRLPEARAAKVFLTSPVVLARSAVPSSALSDIYYFIDGE